MTIFGVALIAVYGFLLIVVLLVWLRLKPSKCIKSQAHVTVIVPVRNEEKTIQATVESIMQNDYPAELREVIIVNDHSTDSTKKILSNLNQDFKLINLEDGQEGKKAAISQAILVAKGDLIICTDGDTVVPANWVSEHAGAFEAGAQLSFGQVSYDKKNLWHEMLEAELSALVAVGAVTSSFGKPSMINGCNYSFSKEAFEKVNGFMGNENVPTGDDEFLLRKISKSFPGRVSFLKTQVLTEPVKSLRHFIDQRRRWASKWKWHHDPISKLMPGLVFLFFLSWVATLYAVFSVQWIMAFVLMGVKFLLDLVFISVISRGLSFRKFAAVGLLQIIYPIYVVFFGLASNFGSYHWRGRNHQI